MTVSPHGMPGVQHGQPPGPAAPGPPAAPAPPPGYDWRNQASPPARRNKGLVAAVAAASILAIAALVVGIINLTRPAPTAQPSAAGAAPTTAAPLPAQNTTDADRALCQAIRPLMAESDKITQAYSNAGGSPTAPERVAATPKFVSDTQDWVDRIQPVVDAHPAGDPFLQRSLQRFIDDRKLLIADLKAGPWQNYDETIYEDSVAAYSAPLSICWNLGVKW